MTSTYKPLPDQLVVTHLVDELAKREIHAPIDYVSVYHETRSDFLTSIAHQGLTPGAEASNMGAPISSTNIDLDKYRPAHLVAAGVSRCSNIYAYPFLELGHGLFGADQRFMPRDEAYHRKDFELLENNQPDYLRKLGALTVDRYIATVIDPSYLREQYPGEVLELKVDPKRCYVADLQSFTDIQDGKNRGWIREADMETEAQEYWQGVIPLSDFTRWYRRAEWADNGNDIKNVEEYRDKLYMAGDFFPLKDAPQDYPESIRLPEILITEPVSTDHMRLLQ